jgi:hypothetical protein
MIKERKMATAMHEVKRLVEHLPENSEIEDIQYHLYVLEKIRRGQNDIKNGKHYSTAEVREHLNKWLNP